MHGSLVRRAGAAASPELRDRPGAQARHRAACAESFEYRDHGIERPQAKFGRHQAPRAEHGATCDDDADQNVLQYRFHTSATPEGHGYPVRDEGAGIGQREQVARHE